MMEIVGQAAVVIATLAAAAVGAWLQRSFDRQRSAKETLFHVYMLLLDADSRHFWITAREARGAPVKQEIVSQFDSLRWRIADEARKIDFIPEVADVLRALFSLGFKSEAERARRLSSLIDALGKKANPRYAKVMREISHENQKLCGDDMDEFFRRQTKVSPL